jgi:anti-sigma B factor antagonist
MERVGDGAGEGRPLAAVTLGQEAAGVATIAITGDLDIATVESVSQRIDQGLDGAPTHVVFDLAQVAFLDSSGLALLLQIAARVGSVEVRHPTPIVRRVIEVTGLGAVFSLEP